MNIDDTIYKLKDIEIRLENIFEENNVEKAYVFGSYAKGKADAKSDIDILLFGNELFSYMNTLGVAESVNNRLNKAVDVFSADEFSEDSIFANKIKQEMKCIYERSR